MFGHTTTYWVLFYQLPQYRKTDTVFIPITTAFEFPRVICTQTQNKRAEIDKYVYPHKRNRTRSWNCRNNTCAARHCIFICCCFLILGQIFWMTAAISGGWIGLEHIHWRLLASVGTSRSVNKEAPGPLFKAHIPLSLWVANAWARFSRFHENQFGPARVCIIISGQPHEYRWVINHKKASWRLRVCVYAENVEGRSPTDGSTKRHKTPTPLGSSSDHHATVWDAVHRLISHRLWILI